MINKITGAVTYIPRTAFNFANRHKVITATSVTALGYLAYAGKLKPLAATVVTAATPVVTAAASYVTLPMVLGFGASFLVVVLLPRCCMKSPQQNPTPVNSISPRANEKVNRSFVKDDSPNNGVSDDDDSGVGSAPLDSEESKVAE